MKDFLKGFAPYVVGFVILVSLTVVIYLWGIFRTMSPDGHYVAFVSGNMPTTYCVVFDLQKMEGVLGTASKYGTANDVKSCAFSPDSTKVAAAYHYGDYYSSYTWIGVWDIKTKSFLGAQEKPGWTVSMVGVFDQ